MGFAEGEAVFYKTIGQVVIVEAGIEPYHSLKGSGYKMYRIRLPAGNSIVVDHKKLRRP